MRVEVGSLVEMMDRIAERQAETHMSRAQNAAARRETAHEQQAAARQRAREAAEESSFWGDIVEVCSWVGAGVAIAATGGAGTAGALALAGGGAMVGAEIAKKSDLIDENGALATGLAVGSSVAIGAAGGMAGELGRVLVGTAKVIEGGATIRSAMAGSTAQESSADATSFRAEGLERAAEVKEATQAATDALAHRTEIQDRAAELLLRRPTVTLKG